MERTGSHSAEHGRPQAHLLQEPADGDQTVTASGSSKPLTGFLKRRWFWLSVLSFVCIGLGTALACWWTDYRSARAVLAAARTSIRQRGEPLAFADVREHRNGDYAIGTRVLAIVSRIKETDQEFRDLISADPPTPPGDYPVFRKSLAENRNALDTLATIDPAEECAFPYNFAQACPISILIPGVSGLQQARDLWKADFLQAMGTGDHDRAMRATVELCDTSQMLRWEPFIISQIVRAQLGNHAVDVLQLLLAEFELSPAQFTSLDQRLARMESSYRLAGTVQAERSIIFTTMQNIGQPEVRKSLDDWGSQSWLDYRASPVCLPERMRQEAWMLETISQLADLIDNPEVQAEQQWQVLHQEVQVYLKARRESLISYLFPDFRSSRHTGLEYRQRLVAARLALRIDRYRSKHGKLPANLEEVLEGALPERPLELFSGFTLAYEVCQDAFTLRKATMTKEDERPHLLEVDYEAGRAEH